MHRVTHSARTAGRSLTSVSAPIVDTTLVIGAAGFGLLLVVLVLIVPLLGAT
jgi:hypothetical protein